jgi:hypothetical protein
MEWERRYGDIFMFKKVEEDDDYFRNRSFKLKES